MFLSTFICQNFQIRPIYPEQNLILMHRGGSEAPGSQTSQSPLMTSSDLFTLNVWTGNVSTLGNIPTHDVTFHTSLFCFDSKKVITKTIQNYFGGFFERIDKMILCCIDII